MLGMAVEHEVERPVLCEPGHGFLDGFDFYDGAVVAAPEVDLLVGRSCDNKKDRLSTKRTESFPGADKSSLVLHALRRSRPS